MVYSSTIVATVAAGAACAIALVRRAAYKAKQNQADGHNQPNVSFHPASIIEGNRSGRMSHYGESSLRSLRSLNGSERTEGACLKRSESIGIKDHVMAGEFACDTDENQVANVLASAAAYPRQEYTQTELLEAFLKRYPLNASDEEFARRIFQRTEIERANIALDREDLYKKMSRDEYVEHLRTNVFELGFRAADQALNAWGGNRDDITHIVFGTMSVVMDTPTTDVHLMRRLGLSSFTKRVCVQQMGCLTGFRLLSLAASIAKESPAHRVLVVCADVRSGLGNQLEIPAGEPGVVDFPRSSIVACALFRDAGGACVVGTQPGLVDGEAESKCAILAHESYLIPDSGSMVKITEGDDATIHWHNDTGLPQAVADNAPMLMERLCATLERRTGLELDVHKVPWCVHTGGPKVLKMVEGSVGLDRAQLATSWEYLRTHGNTTGASNMTILHHFLTRTPGPAEPSSKQPGDLAVMLGIGPGLAMESLVIRLSRL